MKTHATRREEDHIPVLRSFPLDYVVYEWLPLSLCQA